MARPDAAVEPDHEAVPPQRPSMSDLGYFVDATRPAAPSQFGGAPGAAPNQGPPPPPAAPSGVTLSPTARRLLLRIGAPIVVLVVLGLFGVGRFSGISDWLGGDLEAPHTSSR